MWVEPYPDAQLAYEQRESVELAFVAALQHLPPRQRAVLILRDVLGFSAGEVAETLDTTADAVYSTLQRAHRTIDARLPDRSPEQAGRSLRSATSACARSSTDSFVRGRTATSTPSSRPSPRTSR